MARTFVRHGVVALAGVPVNNNDPLGSPPAVYVHWPPLLPILLSMLFRIFGTSEATGHGLMAFILLASAAALYFIARERLPRAGALLAVFFFLTLPVVIQFSQVISQQELAIFFMLVVLLAFLKAAGGQGSVRLWTLIASMAMWCAIWSSWEPFWLPVSLLAAAAWRRDPKERRLAWLLCGVTAAALASVGLLYVIRAPDAVADLMHTIGYRLAVSRTYSAALLNRHSFSSQMSLLQVIQNLRYFYPAMLGPAGVAAILWLLLRACDGWRLRGGSSMVTIFSGLLGPWFFWYATMWNDAATHNFKLLLAAPGAALAMAYWTGAILRFLEERGEKVFWRASAILVAAPLLFLVPLASAVRHNLMRDRSRTYWGFLPAIEQNVYMREPDWKMRYARVIRSATPADAIVFAQLQDMVPVYYSDRHFIRNVQNDADLARTLRAAEEVFPGAPLFLALPPEEASRGPFQDSIKKSVPVAETPDAVVYRLDAASRALSHLAPDGDPTN